MSLKRRITPWLASSRDVKDRQFTSMDRFSAFKNDGSCPAATCYGIAKGTFFRAPFTLLSLLSSLSLSLSPSSFSFYTIGVEERRAMKRKEYNDETKEGGRVMTGRRKNSQLTWASRCRVGVIGFAENTFTCFSRHLHNARGEHGRSIDRLI